MKAAVFEGPQRITTREFPLKKCSEHDIIIKVAACGICGSDVRNYQTGLRDNISRQVMGHEFSGTVTEVGNAVSKFKTGDRVAVAPDVSCGHCYYCRRGWVNLCTNHRMIGTHWPGGFAEYCHLSQEVLEHGIVHHVPGGVSLEHATLAEPASSVMAAQENARISLGDTVLIVGDGPIGCLHAEVARARGASNIIMVGRRRLKEAQKFEPDHLIDGVNQDLVLETLRITDGLGADVAICANPIAATQEQAVESVRKRGTVVLFGGIRKDSPMTTLNSNLIHYNELSVVGAFSYPAYVHADALKAIQVRQINPEMYFTMHVDLDGVVEGIRAAAEGRALKPLVVPG